MTALLCLFLLVDALGHTLLLWLLWRIATGELTAQHPFKRFFYFTGLDKIPEAESEYPKF